MEGWKEGGEEGCLWFLMKFMLGFESKGCEIFWLVMRVFEVI